MANKKSVEQRKQTAREEALLASRKKLRIFPLVSLAIAVILLLLMLTDWAAIYNTDISGNEVEITGFQCVSAGLSGNYSSADKATFGDMAVPFNVYAPASVRTLALVSVIAMFVVILHALIQVFASITNRQGAFNVLDVIFAAASAGLFIACYAVALSMRNSDILPKYCNSNPACSIQSQAILPALFAIISLSSPILAMVFDARGKRALREAEEATQRTPQRSGKGAIGKKG